MVFRKKTILGRKIKMGRKSNAQKRMDRARATRLLNIQIRAKKLQTLQKVREIVEQEGRLPLLKSYRQIEQIKKLLQDDELGHRQPFMETQ